jgi:hypothetical protein
MPSDQTTAALTARERLRLIEVAHETAVPEVRSEALRLLADDIRADLPGAGPISRDWRGW